MLIQRPSKLKPEIHLGISSRRAVPRNYKPQPRKTHDATLRRFRGDGMDQISQKFAVTDIILANECFSIFLKKGGCGFLRVGLEGLLPAALRCGWAAN